MKHYLKIRRYLKIGHYAKVENYPKMRRYTKPILLILMVTAIYFTYNFFKGDPNAEVLYITEKSFIGSIVKRVNATGQIRPLNLIDVGAQVSGQIKKIHVKLGKAVKRGDPLVEIDSSTRQNDLKTAKLQLDSYNAQLLATQTSLRTVTLRYERERRLRNENATSKEAFELVANELSSAKALVAEMKALILQAQLAVDNAQTDLGYTYISAPKAGIVVAVVIEEGQTVNAVQTAPTLLQIVDLSSMEIKIEISEGDITKVKPGMDVEFNILSEPTKMYNTKLVSIDPAYTIMSTGAYSKSSSTTEAVYYYANALIKNDDGLLRIGMTVQSSILIASAKDVILVPTLAIEKITEKNEIKSGAKTVEKTAEKVVEKSAEKSAEKAAEKSAEKTAEKSAEKAAEKIVENITEKTVEKYIVRVLEEDQTIKSYDVVTGLSDGIYTEIKSGIQEGQEIIISQMTLGEISQATNKDSGRYKTHSRGR